MEHLSTELPVILNSNSAVERILSQALPDNRDRLKHVEISFGEFSYKADYYESPVVINN